MLYLKCRHGCRNRELIVNWIIHLLAAAELLARFPFSALSFTFYVFNYSTTESNRLHFLNRQSIKKKINYTPFPPPGGTVVGGSSCYQKTAGLNPTLAVPFPPGSSHCSPGRGRLLHLLMIFMATMWPGLKRILFLDHILFRDLLSDTWTQGDEGCPSPHLWLLLTEK